MLAAAQARVHFLAVLRFESTCIAKDPLIRDEIKIFFVIIFVNG